MDGPQTPPPPPESRPHSTCAPTGALLLSCSPVPCLSGPLTVPYYGADLLHPHLAPGGHATGMFSLTATYRAGHSKGYTKCKIKPNISCSKNRKTFSPLSSTVSLNLSWCFFLFLCYLTSCSFGRGDTHLWGECRPHSTCSSTGVWTANI